MKPQIIKVVKPANKMPDDILGVIQSDNTTEQIEAYVNELNEYYGFSCAVFEEEL